jgi:acetoin utilization deacetylase AcuC-like enzyme
VRHLLRRLRRFLGPPRLNLVYSERYARAFPGVPLDPARGAQVLAFLLDRALVRPREVWEPRPPSLRNLLRVHTEAYLESLERPETLHGALGVELSDSEAHQVVELQRLAVGGTIQATRLARSTRRPTVHLGGGFHHAEPSRGMGFCVFNDVAVAIRRLRAKGFDRPVLVLDLDLHHGNGTRAAFAEDHTVHTFSIHNADWDARPAVASTDIALGSAVDDEAYLAALRQALPPLLSSLRPGLVIYLAGTDPAADDALGDWKITAAGMLARDRLVVEQLRSLPGPRVPLAILLAGGYGHHAWRYTARFLSWLACGRPLEPPSDAEMLVRRFRPLAAQLTEDALTGRTTGEGEWSLGEEDLLGLAPGSPHETRILGHYSKTGFELLLERVGIMGRLHALGYRSPVLDLVAGSGLGQTVRLFGDPTRHDLLMELRVRRDRRLVPDCEVLLIEWLRLQNPRAAFGETRGALPGQEHPGLGILGLVAGLLVLVCEHLGLDGVAHVPAHYHVAAVGHHHLRFLDAVAQARFDALHDGLAGLTLAEANRAIAEGRVRDATTGEAVQWEPAPLVMPVSERLRRLVRGPEYQRAYREARSGVAVVVPAEAT